MPRLTSALNSSLIGWSTCSIGSTATRTLVVVRDAASPPACFDKSRLPSPSMLHRIAAVTASAGLLHSERTRILSPSQPVGIELARKQQKFGELAAESVLRAWRIVESQRIYSASKTLFVPSPTWLVKTTRHPPSPPAIPQGLPFPRQPSRAQLHSAANRQAAVCRAGFTWLARLQRPWLRGRRVGDKLSACCHAAGAPGRTGSSSALVEIMLGGEFSHPKRPRRHRARRTRRAGGRIARAWTRTMRFLPARGARMTRRSQRVQRIDDFAVEDHLFDPPALAFSKRALGRNADFVDAGTPRRRLDLVD